MSLSLFVVIATDAEERHYKGVDNPTYTSHYITTNGITVRQDSPTRELINPIYGSVVRVEEKSTSSDTKRFEAAYSVYGPKADATVFGNVIRTDMSEEYENICHS